MPQYSRTQLAEHTGIPARTIRYYHSLGLLPKAGRVGKTVVYGDHHLERLRDIAAMQARGLRLDAIGEIFAIDGQPANDWRILFDPRTAGEAAPCSATIDDDALNVLLGDRRPEILDELVAAGYLKRQGSHWHVPDQPMLTGALVLYDIGTDISLSSQLRSMIREHIAELADEIVAAFREGLGTSYGGQEISGDLSRFRDRLRAAAREVAGATLADEIERAAREVGEQPRY